MSAGKPIFVTGSHRSGSTWTGKMLALAPEVVYFHEPFNSDYYDPGRCGAQFHYRFTYITAENEQPYLTPLRRTADLRYNWRGALKAARSARDMQAAWQGRQRFRDHRDAGRRALFKDPLALLSAEWLTERLGTTTIVVVRHPAAFVSSIKRFNWRSPLAELLDQPLLMRDYLAPFKAEMNEYARDRYSVVEQAAVFWKLLYFMVDQYRGKHDDWYFVRHEDLSLEPLAGFEALYAFCDLPFTAEIANQIAAFTSPDNPDDIGDHTGVARVNSRANIWSWKQRLTPDEIATVRALTRPVADQFYDAEAWA